MAIDKIMLVIDPTPERQAGFRRALDSARLIGAALHIYLCLDDSYPGAEAGREQLVDRFQLLLNELLLSARQQDVNASSEIEWVEEWRTGVVRAAARCSADMVVKSSFDHSDIQREMRTTSDWELLRHSPCPVLLIKNYNDWQHHRILAAIDVNSKDGAHTQLNKKIVSFASSFAEAHGCQLHVVNAYRDRQRMPSQQQLALFCGVSLSQVHVLEGVADEVISGIAEELGIDLVIIGTVGRSGIRGKLFGNTSEKLLDQTHTDLLVVH
jgi:universal stress protein E